MKVTVDNFCRAETDSYFARHAQDAGGVGRFKHILTPVQVEVTRKVVTGKNRMFRDSPHQRTGFGHTSSFLSVDAGLTVPASTGKLLREANT
jgi:hypothetical protein